MTERSDWPTFLVEHYWPGVTEEEFLRSAGSVAASAERLARNGAQIRFLHSTLVPEDAAAICVLTAASPQLVEQAYADAGVTFERLVEAIESGIPAYRQLPVPIGSDSESTPGHTEQPRTDRPQEEPSWENASTPAR